MSKLTAHKCPDCICFPFLFLCVNSASHRGGQLKTPCKRQRGHTPATAYTTPTRCLRLTSNTFAVTSILSDFTFYKIYTVSQKVPIFKLSVTLSNLNLFSQFLHCWKAYEICYKPIRHYPHHLRHVATLPWEIKNQILCIYSTHVEQNANKLHFKCTDFNFSMRVTVYSECIYVFLSKSCPRY